MEIRTDRLRLRRARESDLDALHAVFIQPAAMRYWSTPPHADLAQTQAWLASMIEAEDAGGDDFVVEFEGRVVGKAGAWRLPEVGFILHPEVWGRGLGREAMEAVIDHLFARHPIAALTADVDPRNLASLGLLWSLGFRETGRAARTMRWGDEWCDSVYLACPRPGGG